MGCGKSYGRPHWRFNGRKGRPRAECRQAFFGRSANAACWMEAPPNARRRASRRNRIRDAMEAEYPLISLLCAVRNDELFIRETLNTVVSQTYPNIELIVMDGASTDRTPAIARQYAARYENPRITVVSEPDKGQWHALEKALALSHGAYIALICGQDGYLNTEWLAKCMDVFK